MRNIERLEELQKLLESVPDDKFDLGVWTCGFDESGKKFDQLIGKCGTSACAVGWACTHHKFNEEGLRYGQADFGEDYQPMYKGETGWGAVMRFFDLSYELVDSLFDEISYYDIFYCEDSGNVEITPKDVAKRIQIVIDNPEHTDEEILDLIGEMENV